MKHGELRELIREVLDEETRPKKKSLVQAFKKIKLDGWSYTGGSKDIPAEWTKEGRDRRTVVKSGYGRGPLRSRSFVLQVNTFPLKWAKGTGEYSATIWVDCMGRIVSFGAPAVNFDLKDAEAALITLSQVPMDELFDMSDEWCRG